MTASRVRRRAAERASARADYRGVLVVEPARRRTGRAAHAQHAGRRGRGRSPPAVERQQRQPGPGDPAQIDISAKQAPGVLASKAAALGMVPDPNPVFLSIAPNGTVTVLGTPREVPAPVAPVPSWRRPAPAAVTTPAVAAPRPRRARAPLRRRPPPPHAHPDADRDLDACPVASDEPVRRWSALRPAASAPNRSRDPRPNPAAPNPAAPNPAAPQPEVRARCTRSVAGSPRSVAPWCSVDCTTGRRPASRRCACCSPSSVAGSCSCRASTTTTTPMRPLPSAPGSIELNALRGEIVDRNGVALAYTTDAQDITVDPKILRTAGITGDKLERLRRAAGAAGRSVGRRRRQDPFGAG